MSLLRLHLTLLLSALACVAAAFGGPAPFRVVAIGAFVVFAPGLLLTHVLRISDALLSLVIMMMTGPSVWVLVATLAAFGGWWAPTATVVVAAALLAITSLALLGRDLVGHRTAAARRHLLAPDAIDEAVVTAPASRPPGLGYDE